MGFQSHNLESHLSMHLHTNPASTLGSAEDARNGAPVRPAYLTGGGTADAPRPGRGRPQAFGVRAAFQQGVPGALAPMAPPRALPATGERRLVLHPRRSRPAACKPNGRPGHLSRDVLLEAVSVHVYPDGSVGLLPGRHASFVARVPGHPGDRADRKRVCALRGLEHLVTRRRCRGRFVRTTARTPFVFGGWMACRAARARRLECGTIRRRAGGFVDNRGEAGNAESDGGGTEAVHQEP